MCVCEQEIKILREELRPIMNFFDLNTTVTEWNLLKPTTVIKCYFCKRGYAIENPSFKLQNLLFYLNKFDSLK